MMKIRLNIEGVDYLCTPIEKKKEIKDDFRVAIVIGHTEKKQGANSKHLNVSEWFLWSEFENHIFYNNSLNFKQDFFYHDPSISSYTKRQQETAQKTADYNLVLELHFNALNSVAHGSFALFNEDNPRTEKLAKKFVELMGDWGFYERKNKEIDLHDDKDDNGEGFIRESKPDALLLEPFFGDNLEDCKRFEFAPFAQVLNKLVAYYQTL